MMTTRPVLIMAGGTGGHVFPALAVADVLRSRGIPVVWLGTQSGIEARLVPQAGFPIEWLSISGWRGKGAFSMLLAPMKLVIACSQALKILIKRKPCVVLGMGGFVSGPGGLMAWLLRKPLLIHEQNAVPGLTNRLLAIIAGQVLEAFPNSFSSFGKKVSYVGNPVRQEIIELSPPEHRFKSHTGALRLLVVGGSLGAVRLNELIPETVASIEEAARPEIWHQTGVKNKAKADELYEKWNVEARVDAFIEDMAEAYAWADIIVCRAGAMTVFELAAAGVASILVPYPHAVDDHQTANASYLGEVDAAIVRQQEDLSCEWLSHTLLELTQHRDRLLSMAKAARRQAKPAAARDVAERCMLAGGLT